MALHIITSSLHHLPKSGFHCVFGFRAVAQKSSRYVLISDSGRVGQAASASACRHAELEADRGVSLVGLIIKLKKIMHRQHVELNQVLRYCSV